MKILKKCLTCGAEFIASKMSNKYCCRECERDASRKREAKRKKSVRESEKEAALDKERDAVASRPFLTPSDVALLLDMSVSTVYRCFYSGIIKAVRIRRKTLVRREDLDKYFEDAGPYRKRSYKRKQEQEYYTLQEIMDKYKIGRKAVWGRCDRLGIPKVYEGRNTFYSKKLIDANFSELLDVIDIDNYYTLSQIMEMYNMTQGAALCFVKYHAVPRVKRNGRSYYSKVHIDCIKHKTDEIDPDWYSYEEAMQKYGITKDQVSYTLKTYSIKTEKRGKFTMIYRTDFDNIMHQRLQNSTPLIKSNGEEKVVFTAKQQEKICPATPEGYYSTDEVAEMFKISIKHAGVITRENNIPKIALKGFNFYEKGSIDLLYNKKNKYAEITDWITPEEMRTTFKMTADGVRSFIHRHKIPAKVEYSNIGEGMKEVKDSVTGLTENVNNAITSADSKWSGMSKFLQGIFSGNGGNMMGNFFSNVGKGNVSGLSLIGLVVAALLVFGRFGWMGKIAGAVLAMMMIGNNVNMNEALASEKKRPATQSQDESQQSEVAQGTGGGRRR